MKLHPGVPILRSYDEGKAREFYVDWLGFKVDWEHRFAPDTPLYMQVSRGEWGAREMVVQDGAGNRLVFFRDLEEL
jgi:catechol 2,3-dioxygenase-like lactoylglutathione lyase family enzyme